MNSRLFIPLLIVGALAFACSPRTRTEASSATPAALATARVATTPPESRAHDDSPLTSRLGVRVGESGVRFALAIANTGDDRLEIHFPSGQTYDFVVLDSIGREVWRWGNGRLFTQALQNKMLGGGDTLSIDEEWKHPKRRGHYSVVATLRSSNFPVQERAEFELR